MKSNDFLPRVNKVKRFAVLMAITVPFLIVSFQTLASDVNKAREHYQQERYKKAGKLWKKIGDRKKDKGEAHYQLAELYKNGLGYEKNHIEAAKFYRKSAEKNYIPAMYALGALHYRDGDKSVRSVRGAIMWWERAAKAGHKTSLLELANLYLQGDERNILTAKHYGRLTALAGEPAGLHVVKRVEDELIKMNILGARRLANIQADKYTIELSSFLAFYQAWEFVVLNNIQNARIHRNIYSDFVVTLGEFNTSDETFTKISQLPGSLISLRPRPRELRVIQRELIPSKTTFAENWLYQRDPKKFTVTLFSADARLDALDFVDEFGLEEAAIYHSKLGQWIVNAGVFNQAAQAQAAMSQLPQKMQALGPLVNSFQAIQGDMMRSKQEIAQLYAKFNKPKPVAEAPQPLPTTIAAANKTMAQQTTVIAQGTAASPAPKKAQAGPTANSTGSRKAQPKRQNTTIRRGKWAFKSGAATQVAGSSKPQHDRTNPASVASELAASEAWLFDKNRNSYSLQLVTVSDPVSSLSTLRRKRRELGNNVHLFDQHDPRYYYLLYGDFETPEAAKNAAQRRGLKGAVVVSLDNHQYKRCEKYSNNASTKKEYERFCK